MGRDRWVYEQEFFSCLFKRQSFTLKKCKMVSVFT